jgi:hypothetical protein
VDLTSASPSSLLRLACTCGLGWGLGHDGLGAADRGTDIAGLRFDCAGADLLRKRGVVVVAVSVAVPNTFLNAQVTDADQVKFALPSMVEELQYAQKSSLAYEEMLALDAMASAFNDIRDIGQPTLWDDHRKEALWVSEGDFKVVVNDPANANDWLAISGLFDDA